MRILTSEVKLDPEKVRRAVKVALMLRSYARTTIYLLI